MDTNYLILWVAAIVIAIIIGYDIANRTNASIAEHPEVNRTAVQADYCYNSPDICDWRPVMAVAAVGGMVLVWVVRYVQ